MENRRHKHKDKNRFRFQPFSERIANIKIDVYHHVKHKYEEESDEVTYFFQTLEKWSLLNCSESFQQLKSEITVDVQILPQILMLKDKLVAILKQHLSNKNPYNLQAVLELVVALAKDLRQDFYPYFLPIYELLVPLLSTTDTELIENTFQCLAYLFKFLWRYLAKNLQAVFDSLLPLLSSSKPHYINNFAAQSFAFVARKIKDHLFLIRIILKSLKKCQDGIEGCGRLIFEILHGVKGQFHSCAEITLNSLFMATNEETLPQALIWKLLQCTVSNIVTFIHIEHISLLWKIVLEYLNIFSCSWIKDKNERNTKNVEEILNVVLQIVKAKNCKYVTDAENILNNLIVYLENNNQDIEIMEKISQIFSPILLAPSLCMSHDLSKSFVVNAITYFNQEVLMSFISSILSFKHFEAILLPIFLDFCKTIAPENMLPLFTKIIIYKRPPAKNGQELLKWSPYVLNLIDNDSYGETYLSMISEPSEKCFQNFDNYVRVLIVLPHIKPIQKDKAIIYIQKQIEFLCKYIFELEKDSSDSSRVKALFLLCLSVETLMYLKPKEDIDKLCSTELLVTTLLPYADAEHLYVLRMLDFYVIMSGSKDMSALSTNLKKKLISNLTSPYSKVREYAIHLLYELEKLSSDSEEMIPLLEVCWKAETTPITLNDYREKLKFLQKLDASNESLQQAIAKNKLDHNILIRYLLGALYVNFKLIWAPVSELISSYATILTPNQFWSVFGPELAHVGSVIREQIEEPKIDSSFECEALHNLFMDLNGLDERPDHINHRILLWELLANCVTVCEAKNRDIVAQFFLFLHNEYWKRHSDNAQSWDISLKNNGNKDKENINIDEKEMVIDENEENNAEIEQEESLPVFENKNRAVTKSLLAHMKVLGKIRSPKNVYREPELYKIYIDFLSNKIPDVQTAALDCIMMYKHKFLLPYREHLYGLIEDKTFKKEVTTFRIDKESDIIRPEHRTDLIPFVLRIVYSKMFTKGSAMKGITKQERKASVIRFLAGCSAEELASFFKMAFAIFDEKVKTYDNILLLAEKSILDLDLERVVPPRRIQSQIYLLNTVLIYCGGLLDYDHQTYLLRILISLSGHISGAFLQRDRVHPGYVRTLRDIRNICFESLIKFYEKFESYPWTQEETDAVFKVLIWPYLKKLPVEGIYSPTAQLKLFMVWSKNPRYFVLLGKYQEEDHELSPLSLIIQLWLSPKIHGSVSNTIMDIVGNLLTLQLDDVDSPETKRLEVTNAPVINKEKLSALKQSINYGSILLLPFTSNILELLQRKLSTKQGLNRKDMEVMSRLTELVSDAESCDKLLFLLLPVLLKKSGSGDEVIIPLLNTAYNLIKKVNNPGSYVRKLAPLYGSVEGSAARKLLFSIVIELSKQAGSESGLDESLLSDLNAWDAKWIDQPDFSRRIKAFKKLEELLKENDISVNLGIIVIYTCFHFIKTEKDLSLRENAKYCLLHICPALFHSLQKNNKEKNFVIGTVLHLIRKGLMDKQNDNLRNDSVSLLGHLARECSSLHPVLNDLSALSNKADMEVDFFENIQHIQLHRRVRAFLKFSSVAETLEKSFLPRTLMDFILPLISYYLLTEKFSNKHTIIDSAIKALGTVCQMLPWRQYQSILSRYIQSLQDSIEFQKQLVRIVVEILNAFHFDLSLADDTVFKKSRNNDKDVHLKLEQKEEKDLEKMQDDKEGEIEDDTITISDNESVHDQEMTTEDIAVDESSESQSQNKTLKLIKLTQSNATRVIRLIAETLLPQLHKTLAQRTQSEVQHKLNRKTTGPDRDEEDVLRVPLAIAVVKLLQKLPTKRMLDTNLPGVFMKLCTFLKSRLDSVRRVTRETLQIIMVSLGTSYLPMLIHEMSTLLTKGFHVHVLVYSLHSVLRTLKPYYQKGDLDPCIYSLVKICSKDLFGHASEEKEVNQILGKIIEARANRSYDVFHILASYASENYLINLIIPLKEELFRTMSHKSVSKVRECLQQVVLGLTENEFISPESLLQFAYGTSSESIPALTAGMKKEPVDPKKAELDARKQTDCFIIPNEPKKKKALESITCGRTNANLLVEFGLRLFYFLFKREKLKDQNYASHLDPVVILLSDCLKSQHVKVSILAIQCLCWVLKMDLPTVRQKIREISIELFSILHKYASAGLSNKGDNYELVMTTFKAVAVVVRDVKHYKLDDEQIRALLLYCEQDLDDYARQVTAFSLLKAVIKRKINAPELMDVMKKVGILSISSNQDSIRLQARQVMLHFLMEYTLGKRIAEFISFYFSQLNYDEESGRTSALEMIKNITNAFPIKALQEHSPVIFINVSTCLVNDPTPECRKQAAEIIGLLLNRIDNNSKDKLFDVSKLWLEDSKVTHRRLAAQVLGLFVAVEKKDFEKRLPEIFSLITRQFIEDYHENIPGRFVLLNPPQPVKDETLSDHHLYHVLHMLVKVGSLCPDVLTNKEYVDHFEAIAEHTQSLLGHDHEWVRHSAVQLLGQIVSATPAVEFAEVVNDSSLERSGFLMSDTTNKIRALALDLTSQLIPSEESNEKFLMQCMKLLVYIAEIVKNIKLSDDSHPQQLSLTWLIKQIRKKINLEVVHAPKSFIVRKMCFNWIAAIAVKLTRQELEPLASLLLYPLVREMNHVEDNNLLRKLASESASYIKKKLGNDGYRSVVADITRRLEIKKAERRKERTHLMVTDPERAAKRKINKQLKKKELKKRKMELVKNHKYKKKPRKDDLQLEE